MGLKITQQMNIIFILEHGCGIFSAIKNEDIQMAFSFISQISAPPDLSLTLLIKAQATLQLDEVTARRLFNQTLQDHSRSLTAVDQKGWTALMHAVDSGNLPAVRWLLEQSPAMINRFSYKADGKQFPLLLAIRGLFRDSKQHALRMSILDILLKQPGININQADANGTTALMAVAGLSAEEQGSLGLLEKLLAAHKDKIKLGLKNNSGNTALHHAVMVSHQDMVEKLLDIGALQFCGPDIFLKVNELHQDQPEMAKIILGYLYAYARLEPAFSDTVQHCHQSGSPEQYKFYQGLVQAAKINRILFQNYLEIFLENGTDDFQIKTTADKQIPTGAFPLEALFIAVNETISSSRRREELVIARPRSVWPWRSKRHGSWIATPCKKRRARNDDFSGNRCETILIIHLN